MPGDYYEQAMDYLVDQGVISGYADHTFRPYNTATRGQLVKIVVGAYAWPIDTSGGPHFADVPADSTFYDFVETAFKHRLVSGYDDGSFRPGASVTRAQASKILVMAAGWSLPNPATATFGDVPRGSTFFGYIEAAAAHGVISGYQDHTFRPANSTMRAQLTRMVYQAMIAR